MTEKISKTQENKIQEEYNFIKGERIVTSKDVAFYWILKIGQDYDGKSSVEELKELINEIMAYAQAGKDCLE